MNLSTKKRYLILSREYLKVIAMFFMLLDHAYMTVVNVAGYQWMTQIGRIAFPIFAFQITEGYTHTSNKNRYTLNMLVFALISEVPYNLMMSGDIIWPFQQNVMFTFLIALLFLKLIDKINYMNIHVFIKILLISGVCMLSVLVGAIAFVDYSGLGVLTVIIFYIAKILPIKYMERLVMFIGLWVINWELLGGKVIILSNGFEFPEQGIALMSLLFIWTYNGKKVLSGHSDKLFKYFTYLFYPAHILLLSLIGLYVL